MENCSLGIRDIIPFNTSVFRGRFVHLHRSQTLFGKNSKQSIRGAWFDSLLHYKAMEIQVRSNSQR